MLIHLRPGSKWMDTLDIWMCTITSMCARACMSVHTSWSDQDALKASLISWSSLKTLLDCLIVGPGLPWLLDFILILVVDESAVVCEVTIYPLRYDMYTCKNHVHTWMASPGFRSRVFAVDATISSGTTSRKRNSKPKRLSADPPTSPFPLRWENASWEMLTMVAFDCAWTGTTQHT